MTSESTLAMLIIDDTDWLPSEVREWLDVLEAQRDGALER
jgi:hypothetical protein